VDAKKHIRKGTDIGEDTRLLCDNNQSPPALQKKPNQVLIVKLIDLFDVEGSFVNDLIER